MRGRTRSAVKRFTKWLVLLLLPGTVLIGLAAYLVLRASLPVLDGTRAVVGPGASLTIERDRLGVPTLRASDRRDLAFAAGWSHAQDRFFQMDLMRRQAAGELAELFGPVALEVDRRLRVHGFRDVARRVLEEASGAHRGLLESYAAGVNAGLEALGARPFEYLLLRSAPRRWLPEDSALVGLAMFLILQGSDNARESDLGLMHDILPAEVHAFLNPPGTEWDAPLAGAAPAEPPLPPPGVYDLRTLEGVDFAPPGNFAFERARDASAGSNNWAVAGAHTTGSGAIVANDMHLGLRVPNTWYRMRWLVQPAGQAAASQLDMTGVTLPGVPVMVAGSNGLVAWGFTNSYGDWMDLVIVEPDPADPGRYRTPQGYRTFGARREQIQVKGSDPVTMEVRTTIWGPVLDTDHRGRTRALSWVAHRPEATNFELLGLEHAGTVNEALEVANRAGIPAQNIVAGDAEGAIGWSIAGRIPVRRGFHPRLPASWASPGTGWIGWLAPQAYPRLVNPPSGRIWTANARVVSGEPLSRIGDGGYALGARAGQIRDGLLELEVADVADMLALQLDDRALFLARWRELILETLGPAAVAGRPDRERFRSLVEGWIPRASVDSVGFRLVRAYRLEVHRMVLAAMTAEVRAAVPGFSYHSYRAEGPVWRLVTRRPAHLLSPRFETWERLLLEAADRTIAHFRDNYGPGWRSGPGGNGTRSGLPTP